MPSQSDYERAFDLRQNGEIAGFIEWDQIPLSCRLFHACDLSIAEAALSAGKVVPRSRVNFIAAKGHAVASPGLWLTFNDYAEGYEFGSFRFQWATSAVLTGKKFLVIRRENQGVRWTFIEFGGQMPAWLLPVQPQLFLQQCDGAYVFHGSTIYNVVLTSPLPVEVGSTVIHGVAHRGRTDALQGKQSVRHVAEKRLAEWLYKQPEYKKLITSFPDLVGHKIALFEDLEVDLEFPCSGIIDLD